YTFTGLAAGTYYVAEETPAGYIGTSPLVASASWTPAGPAPIFDGQAEGIPNNPVAGAVRAIAPHPTDPNTVYVAAVNGGIWKTTNATAASPTWTPLTDQQGSLSMGALKFDPTDATNNTLVAGVGTFSSDGFEGGSYTGLMK